MDFVLALQPSVSNNAIDDYDSCKKFMYAFGQYWNIRLSSTTTASVVASLTCEPDSKSENANWQCEFEVSFTLGSVGRSKDLPPFQSPQTRHKAAAKEEVKITVFNGELSPYLTYDDLDTVYTNVECHIRLLRSPTTKNNFHIYVKPDVVNNAVVTNDDSKNKERVGGYEWRLSACSAEAASLAAMISCKPDKFASEWSVEFDVSFEIGIGDGENKAATKFETPKSRHKLRALDEAKVDVFNGDLNPYIKYCIAPGYVVLDCNITILNAIGKRASEYMDFTQNLRHATLQVHVEDAIFYVPKDWLAMESPVFEAMFFGEDVKEKIEGQLTIEDTKKEYFDTVLQVLYHRSKEYISMDIIDGILAIADKYQIARVLAFCEEVLIRDFNGERVWKTVLKYLDAALTYRLYDLQHDVISNCSLTDIDELNRSGALREYSEVIQRLFMDRALASLTCNQMEWS